MGWGAAAVSIAVTSLMLAAALLGWRFEKTEPNEAWSDTYVLRHKINTVLTLFFIGSALLVVTTVALSSGANWAGGVLDTIATATASDAKAGAADADQSGTAATPSQPQPPTSPPATEKKTPSKFDPIATEFDSLKTLRSSISAFAGSLLLILIFVPALYCLTGEIEMAGKCHASADAAQTSPPPATPRSAPVLTKDSSRAVFEVLVRLGPAEVRLFSPSKTRAESLLATSSWSLRPALHRHGASSAGKTGRPTSS
jgi:hypothetical protein